MANTDNGQSRSGGSDTKGSGASTQVKIVIPADLSMVTLLGSGDELLHVIEREFAGAGDIHVRGNEITVTGPPESTALVQAFFEELLQLVKKGAELTPDAIERTAAMLRKDRGVSPADVLTVGILSARGRTIRPKTLNQKRYADAIDKHTIVFSIGPAGTGKTYLAMAKAVKALQAKEVNRIILTRPAVEAGERLGFLPGTLYEKIDPYLRPLYDALHDMVDPDSIPRLMSAGTIEIAPLAYMRGRAQPVNTNVLTPDGWRPIGELTVGDLVIGSNGKPTPVLGVYPQGEKGIYRVTAQDGASTLCCGEHLWTVRTASDRRRSKPWRVLETRAMAGKLRAAHAHRYELPMLSGPACFPARRVPMDPYALGLLLGDGCLTGATTPAFSTADLVPGGEVKPRAGLMLADSRFESKSVPEAYLYNEPRIRLGVLQGLLDASAARKDGENGRYSSRFVHHFHGTLQYRTTSPQLRDDVIFLVRSFGGIAVSSAVYDAYLVDIRLPAADGRPMRFIDSVKPVGRAECVCIAVAAEDSLYTTEDFLLTHNTLNDSFIILDEAQNTTPEQMKMFLTRLGFGSRIVVTGDVTQVDLPSGQVSGLRIVQDILGNIEDIHFSRLTSQDVVRHRLVGKIVDAYERYDATNTQQGKASAQRMTRRK